MKEEIVKEYYDNGELKSEGMWISLMNCTSIGGPQDCQGKGCVECIDLTTRKDGIWKYYYNNCNLRMEGEYNGYNDKPGEDWDLRCGVWKIYDKTGQLSDEIIYKNSQ